MFPHPPSSKINMVRVPTTSRNDVMLVRESVCLNTLRIWKVSQSGTCLIPVELACLFLHNLKCNDLSHIFGYVIFCLLSFGIIGFPHKQTGLFGSSVFHRQTSSPLHAVCADLHHLHCNAVNLYLQA